MWSSPDSRQIYRPGGTHHRYKFFGLCMYCTYVHKYTHKASKVQMYICNNKYEILKKDISDKIRNKYLGFNGVV